MSTTYNSNIYVKFIPSDVTEDELRKTFTMKDSNIVSLKLSNSMKKILLVLFIGMSLGAQAQQWEWAKETMSNANNIEMFQNMETDSIGNIYFLSCI